MGHFIESWVCLNGGRWAWGFIDGLQKKKLWAMGYKKINFWTSRWNFFLQSVKLFTFLPIIHLSLPCNLWIPFYIMNFDLYTRRPKGERKTLPDTSSFYKHFEGKDMDAYTIVSSKRHFYKSQPLNYVKPICLIWVNFVCPIKQLLMCSIHMYICS